MSSDSELPLRIRNSVIQLVLPDRNDRPDLIGSAVLVDIDGKPFAFTAAHVLAAAQGNPFHSPEGPNENFAMLPVENAWQDQALDVAVIPLTRERLAGFSKYTFLKIPKEIDEADLPDDYSPHSFYNVFGWPVSRSRTKVNHIDRHVSFDPFHLTTSPVGAEVYAKEAVSPADYLLMEFDRKNTILDGKKSSPPALQGCSGGAVFYRSRLTDTVALVGIATDHKIRAKAVQATRIKRFLNIARLITSGVLQLST
jgi:hypothetical protein